MNIFTTRAFLYNPSKRWIKESGTIRGLDQFIPVPFIKREDLLGKNAAMFSSAQILYYRRSKILFEDNFKTVLVQRE